MVTAAALDRVGVALTAASLFEACTGRCRNGSSACRGGSLRRPSTRRRSPSPSLAPTSSRRRSPARTSRMLRTSRLRTGRSSL
eukprot:3161885-Prymnesium_polylepis.1